MAKSKKLKPPTNYEFESAKDMTLLKYVEICKDQKHGMT